MKMGVDRDTRILYQGIGICPRCKKNRLYFGEKTCIECKAMNLTYQERYRARHKEKAAELARINGNKVYQKRKEQGLCTRCGKKAKPGRTMCYRCMALRTEYNRIRKLRMEDMVHG